MIASVVVSPFQRISLVPASIQVRFALPKYHREESVDHGLIGCASERISELQTIECTEGSDTVYLQCASSSN